MRIVLFISFLAVMFAIGYFGERMLRAKLEMKPKEKGVWYKPVNNIHKWGERILIILFILFALTQDFSKSNTLLIWVGFIVTLNVFRSLMEWKYARESREHIVTICGMFYLIVFLPGMIYLF